jgi:predicted secreted hydrolase
VTTPLARRRRLLGLIAALGTGWRALAQSGREPVVRGAAGDAPAASVTRNFPLRFPYDEGSHPAFRTEWWYVTGWLEDAARHPLGFQITFFRVRSRADGHNPSAFDARQIIIAHAALSDAGRGHLLHDQAVARAAFGLAGADEGRTRVWLDDWSLAQEGRTYRARIPAREFDMHLVFTATQPPLLQGDEGYSRKGPDPASASYYYSLPQLRVAGELAAGRDRAPVRGTAWLDHEWSSSYMDERASGWDWIGINLEDGGALMLFRMRDPANNKFWAGGTYRDAAGMRTTYAPDDVDMQPSREWRSPRTGAAYPVAWRIRAGALELAIEPLMDDQENDTRTSVGTVYWEGAVRALAKQKTVGRGYLELTGYWKAMRV